MDKSHPLMLVFYLNREMMMQKDIIVPFTDSVNIALAERETNAMAFFIPTDDAERIECINPLIVPEDKMLEIEKIVEDLKNNFDVGKGADGDDTKSDTKG